MAKTLVNAVDLEQIRQRISALTPESPRGWGTMSVGGMVCHLYDSYQVGLGERMVAPVRLPLPRGAVKYLALRTPLRWAKDMKSLMLTRFSASSALDRMAHPFFGSMTRGDWLRWGYLHAHHHLRQFDA